MHHAGTTFLGIGIQGRRCTLPRYLPPTQRCDFTSPGGVPAEMGPTAHCSIHLQPTFLGRARGQPGQTARLSHRDGPVAPTTVFLSRGRVHLHPDRENVGRRKLPRTTEAAQAMAAPREWRGRPSMAIEASRTGEVTHVGHWCHESLLNRYSVVLYPNDRYVSAASVAAARSVQGLLEAGKCGPMLKRFAFLAPILSVVLACGGQGGSAESSRSVTTSDDHTAAAQAAVRAAWDTYQVAVLDGDGAAAVDVLSKGTIDYYDELADAALHADHPALDQMPVLDVVTVLVARYEYPVDKLVGLNGRRFLELAIHDGLIDESTVAGLTFDQVEISGSTARLTTSDTTQALRGVDMRKEGGRWKIHLVTLMREFGRSLDRSAARQGMSPSEAALEFTRMGKPHAGENLFELPR